MKLDSIYLKKVCEPARFDYPAKNIKLAHELLRLMKKENGIGLAANQAGINLRLFVMNIENRYFHCFNPSILGSSETLSDYNEGCLSFPDKNCLIRRPESVMVRYYSANGQLTEEILSGLAARCFQHELDHLDGITMFDRK